MVANLCFSATRPKTSGDFSDGMLACWSGTRLHFPSIHTVLAQWAPPYEQSRSVSLLTSGMYLARCCCGNACASDPGEISRTTICISRWSNFRCNVVSTLGYICHWPTSLWAPKATATGFRESLQPIQGTQKMKVETGGPALKTPIIPWKILTISLTVWAIVVNNLTFHYALYVLMNWLPTYFELSLQLSLQDMGSLKMMLYLNMFIFSNIGGVIADHLITRRILSVTKTRKVLNTIGFVVASFALVALPMFHTSGGAVFFLLWLLVSWH